MQNDNTKQNTTPPAPNLPQSSKISYDDFQKVEIKVGKVLSAEKIPDTDKLYKLFVDFAEPVPRQIVSGIALYVTPEELIGKKFPFVTNLEPRMIRGNESNGMILAVNDPETFSLLSVKDAIKEGSRVK